MTRRRFRKSDVASIQTNTLIKLGLFATVAILCFVLVVGALRSGGGTDHSTYDARFDDVSGMYEGDDVRMSGVLVGTVTGIELDNGKAKVAFGVDSDRSIRTTTKVAVRYQNLLGQRYLELIQPDESGPELPSGSSIGDDMTIPSFDITDLFDGFEPIFETLDTDQVNLFAQNVLDLVQGDGSGLGSVLRDLDGLTTYAQQRETIIVLLIRNLGAISGVVGDRSEQLGRLLVELDRVVSTFANQADALLASVDDINNGQGPFLDIGEMLRETYDSQYAPVNGAYQRLVPGAQQVVDLLAMTPGLLHSVDGSLRSVPEGTTHACSAGETGIPGIGLVVLGNQKLTVCK